jgi:hypothetical protein
MNKNQKIALIVGGIILAIVLLTSIQITRGYDKYRYNAQEAFIKGGVVAALTFVAYIALKSKD